MAQEIDRRMAENGAPVSPAPDVSRLSTAELVTALQALPYRQSAFLLMRLAQGRSTQESATFYGITPEAFRVHLLRAGLALTRAAALPCREPENDAEEDVWARALAEALERETAVPEALRKTVALCRRMSELGREVAAALEAAEREQEESPKGQREDTLRRVAVAALLVLTAFLYCNRPEEAPERRVQPRSMER